jgi:hypothetical protein
MDEQGKKKRQEKPRKELLALNCTAAQYLTLKTHVLKVNERRFSLGMPEQTLSN